MKNLTVILIITLLTACSSSSKKTAENLYYRFPVATIQSVKNINIEVKRPSAMGILGNRPMVVQTSDNGLVQMSNNFWLDSPKVLLQNYLKEVFVTDDKEPILELNSQILALEKKQNEAVLSIKFILLNDENIQIFDKTYKSKMVLTSNSIANFSKTIGELLEDTVTQLSQDIQ